MPVTHTGKRSDRPLKKPVVDIGQCTLCEGCLDMAPSVFQMNDVGYIEVADLDVYPEDEVNDAIKYCPEDCISWE